MAAHFDRDRFGVRWCGDDDLGDQAAQAGVQVIWRAGGIGVRQLLEAGQVLAVARQCGLVQLQRLARRGGFELRLDLALFGLQRVDVRHDQRRVGSLFNDGVDTAGNLARDFAETSLETPPFAGVELAQPRALGVVDLQILGEQVRCRERALQRGERQLLDLAALDAAPVVAAATLPEIAALDALDVAAAADRREAAAKRRAAHQAGERARPVHRPWPGVHVPIVLLAQLRCGERLVVDDAQVRCRRDAVLLFRVGT